jgi:hypothetical protein
MSKKEAADEFGAKISLYGLYDLHVKTDVLENAINSAIDRSE